jgi:hypothetical protein
MTAVPELIRRVAADHGRYDVSVARPHKRGDIPKVRARFETYLQVALLDGLPVLWVLDYDCDDCNDVDAHTAEFASRAAGLAGSIPVEFVLMVREFETLFLSDHETTRAVLSDIPADLQFPADPESIRDAKGWLSQARPKGSAYKPTQHQQRANGAGGSAPFARTQSVVSSIRAVGAAADHMSRSDRE